MPKSYKPVFDTLFKEVNKVIIGQNELISEIMTAILADSNCLLEGYPGLAKTLAVRTLSEVLDLKYSRIQNTPDLMPSDITGTFIIEETSGKRNFRFQPGPIFANIVLADEINRATPKSQSALLEAMQEKQVTVGDKTYKLDLPFFVLATQNPIEQEGSLALHESVFVNSQLKTGHELLEMAKDNVLAEDKKGIKLYDLNATTLALNPDGKLEEQACLLYTLPYKDEMIEVTTKTGKKITVTKNHPFLVNEQGNIRWKKAEELTKLDFLVNPAKLYVEPREVMSHEEALRKMSYRIDEIPFDKDFAFWIACILSNGSIGEKCLEFCQKNYPKALVRWITISKKYGFTPSTRNDSGCIYARIYSKPLIEYLSVRFNMKGGKDKKIPSWFLSFPDDMNREFVKTFISLESSLGDDRIVFTQKSAKNTNLLAHMLLRERIISWIRHDESIFRIIIQGEDFLKFVKEFGWVQPEKCKGTNLERKTKSVFRVVPVHRKKILRLVDMLGLNSFHTLKGRKDLLKRAWYGSYKGIQEGGTVMAVDALRNFVKDIKNEIRQRKDPDHAQLLNTNPRAYAASIGTPMSDVVKTLPVSKHAAWSFYKGGQSSAQMVQYLQQRHELCVDEAEQHLKYCELLLSHDVFYDGIESLRHQKTASMAFGLTVPELKNYLGGFGACGINHNTYPLPEAQQDRFLLKVRVEYPTQEEETKIVDMFTGETPERKLKKILSKQQILHLQQRTRLVPIANDLKKRVINLIYSTRTKKDIVQYGASPRASIGLILAAKARALMNGRNHVSSEDIEAMAAPVLRHRIILNFEAERKGLTTDDAIAELLKKSK